MAVLEDIRGNPLTGANDHAATAYMEGLTRFNLFIGDPVASAEAAVAAAARAIAAVRRAARELTLQGIHGALIGTTQPGSGGAAGGMLFSSAVPVCGSALPAGSAGLAGGGTRPCRALPFRGTDGRALSRVRVRTLPRATGRA